MRGVPWEHDPGAMDRGAKQYSKEQRSSTIISLIHFADRDLSTLIITINYSLFSIFSHVRPRPVISFNCTIAEMINHQCSISYHDGDLTITQKSQSSHRATFPMNQIHHVIVRMLSCLRKPADWFSCLHGRYHTYRLDGWWLLKNVDTSSYSPSTKVVWC